VLSVLVSGTSVRAVRESHSCSVLAD